MKSTYLVQRLQRVLPKPDCGMFTFGGGQHRGGINDNAWDILNKIFRFDYMGAAEFEFGEVPKSLDNIMRYVKKGNAAIGEITVHRAPIYYVCNKFEESEVKVRIKELATVPRKFRTKEAVYLDEAIAARVPDNIVPEKKDKYKHFLDYVGWLELDNHFIFFIDKDVFDNFIMILTIDKPEEKKDA